MTAPSRTFIVSLTVSEGRSPEIIEAIARAVIACPGITLVDVRPNRTYNRVTVLFGGAPAVLPDAVVAAAAVVRERVALADPETDQKPYGTLDAVWVIPLAAERLDAAAAVGERVGERLAAEFDLPVYLTYALARRAERASIHTMRERDATTLGEVMEADAWRPDFGPAALNPAMGAVLVGARLWHVNFILYFDTRDADLVEELTRMHEVLAENGEEGARFLEGSQTYTELAVLLGRIETFIDQTPEVKVVRVFCNVPDYRDTPIDRVIEVFKKAADKLGIPIFGLRLTGFVPAEVLVEAGRRNFPSAPDLLADEELRYITLAIQQLQLNSIDTFNIRRQVLDYHFVAGGDPSQDHGPV